MMIEAIPASRIVRSTGGACRNGAINSHQLRRYFIIFHQHRDGAQSLVEQDQVARLPDARHPVHCRHPEVPEPAEACPAFVATGAAKWNDPRPSHGPMGYQPNSSDGGGSAAYALCYVGTRRIGILYQNDDYGKDYLKGFEDDRARTRKMIVMKQTYEVTAPHDRLADRELEEQRQPTCSSISPRRSSPPRPSRKAADRLEPPHFLNNVSSSLGTVLKPGGPASLPRPSPRSYMKEVTDPQWKNDKGFTEWVAFMKKYYPTAPWTIRPTATPTTSCHPDDPGAEAGRQ